MTHLVHFNNSFAFQFGVTALLFGNLLEKSFNKEVKNRISLEEFIILDTLVCYPHIDKNILAKTIVKEQASVDKLIAKLLKKKLIKEVQNNGSEIRVKYYELTKEGTRIYQDIVPERDIIADLLGKFLSDGELNTFMKTLTKTKNILISLADVEYMM